MGNAPTASPARTRWVGVGRSRIADAERAGAEAAALAIEGQSDGKLLVVLASWSHDAAAVARGVARAAPGVPLIGCQTPLQLAADGPHDGSVVVTCLGGPGFAASTAMAHGAAGSLRDAGAEAAACLGDVAEHPHRVLLVIADGLAGDGQEIVRGAYSVAGAGVPLVGGLAGDELRSAPPVVLCDDQASSNAVAAAALGSDAPLGIGVRHGWRPVGDPMLVTSAQGEVVAELDDRPALDAILDRLEAPAHARREGADFTRFALYHPVGLARRSGEQAVRTVTGADWERRSISFTGAVPQGALLWPMEGDEASVLGATDAACDEALAALAGAPPRGLLAFSCLARRSVLGADGVGQEVERIAARADGVPVAGFHTYGEIARTRGIAGYHNQTLVVLAVG